MNDLDFQRLEERLRQLEEGPKHDEARIDALLQLAWAIALAEPARSLELTEEALALAEAVGSPRGVAIAKRNQAYLLLVAGHVKEPLALGLALLQELQDLGEMEAKATVCDILFHCHERVGDLKMAMQYNLQNLEIHRSLGLVRGEAWALHNMGSVTAQMGEPDRAVVYYEQARALFSDIGYRTGESRVQSRLGLVLRAQGRHEEALKAQQQARELSEELGLAVGVAQANADMGREYESLGRLDLARTHYAEAVCAFEQLGNLSALAETLVWLARLALAQGQVGEARAHLQRAFELLQTAGAKTIELAAHEVMAEVCEAQGDLAGALGHLRQHNRLFGEVYDLESRSELRNLHIRMEMQEATKDAEIHRLRYVELETMQAQLLQAERLAALGGLAAGLAHEVNNPLGVIRSNLDLTRRAVKVLQDALPEQEAQSKRTQAAVKAIYAGVDASTEAGTRIHDLVRSLRRFVRLDESDYAPTNLVEGLQSALMLLSPSLRADVQVQTQLEPLPEILCYASEVNQAFMTLLRNAAEAIEGTGTVTVRSRTEPGHAVVEIEDTGCGMSESQLEGLFELGFQGHGKRVHFRLGLPTAAATVKKQGGTIEVTSEVGVGTCFVLRFPVDPAVQDV